LKICGYHTEISILVCSLVVSLMIMFPSMKTFAQCDSTPPTLEYGASGNEVKVLQQLLQNSGHDPGSIDGKFGPNTRNAIIKLQEANGLVMDGKVGPQTWNVLCGFANTGPTTSGPTTSGPTTSGPTTSGPTTSGPTTSGPSATNQIIKWQKVNRGYGGLEANGGGQLKPELTKLRDENKIQITDDEISILQNIAKVETGGNIQGINTWDSAVLSFGFMQWTLKYGELQDLVKRISNEFKPFGIEIEGAYVFKTNTDPPKSHSVPAFKGVTNYNILRGQDWAEKFYRAGLQEPIILAETKKALEQLHAYENRNGLLSTAWNNHFKNPTAISLIFEAHNNLPVAAKNALRNTLTQTKDQTITDKEFNEILATNILKAYKAYNPNESSERLVKLILGYIPSVQSGVSGVN